jgi:hypothetical protein
MRNNRLTRTLLAAAVLVAAAGAMAPPRTWISLGIPSDAFWIAKAFNAQRYDMVLAGDSRVLKGLSPTAMRSVFPGARIYNFAFDHNAYNREYLVATEALMDKSSTRKTIVLGITPQSLTSEAAHRNGFLSLRANGGFDRFSMRYLSPYLRFFKPYEFSYYYDLLHRKPRVKYYEHHYADGWVASRKEPEDPDYQIRLYRGRFENNEVSPLLRQQLFDFVRKWNRQGIEVFGVRLPSSTAMLQLENAQSGFDQGAFSRGFEEAGGIWIELQRNDYHSYDGSHLREDAARRLSVDLARKMECMTRPSGIDTMHAKGPAGCKG